MQYFTLLLRMVIFGYLKRFKDCQCPVFYFNSIIILVDFVKKTAAKV